MARMRSLRGLSRTSQTVPEPKRERAVVVSSILRTSKLGKMGLRAGVKLSGGGAVLAGTCMGR